MAEQMVDRRPIGAVVFDELARNADKRRMAVNRRPLPFGKRTRFYDVKRQKRRAPVAVRFQIVNRLPRRLFAVNDDMLHRPAKRRFNRRLIVVWHANELNNGAMNAGQKVARL
ncbi:hypothetical protein LR69_02695 [Geobacillus sp. BCO2]|nr:hypothetical protein LR69_02695 [Geobacillus sp. BCO2]